MKDTRILIIDDDRDVLDALAVLVEDDFTKVVKESNPNRMEAIITDNFDVVLLDMNFSAGVNTGNEGLFWLSRIKQLSPSTEIVVMTAYGNITLAVEAIKRGARDFVLKPWDNEKLLATLKSAIIEKKQRKTPVNSVVISAYVEGVSAIMKSLQDQIKRVAATDASVLLLGENGTGKEVFARMIHRLSKRASQSFTSVDLSTIPATLFESELFGHKKGSFTDAKTDRQGKLVSANHGTLFLDEIGNLPLAQQVKLLTVLQSRAVTPVGSTDSVPVDVRIVSATNANLVQSVASGEFRQDLLYRINTITITVPPLRERTEDIPLLANHFLNEFRQNYDKPSLKMSASALSALKEYAWPGNVRELRHTIEKAVILSDTDLIDADNLSLSMSGRPRSGSGMKTLEDIEKDAMINALNTYGGNIVHAARALGITRQTLYNKMRKYGI